jgi:hypothetical protein
VYRAPDGGLVRAEGLDQEGVWELVGENGSGHGEFHLRLAGRGFFPVAPLFFDTPEPGLWLPVGSWFFPAGGYLRWTGDAPAPGPPPGPEPTCGHFREPIMLTSVEQADQLLVGAWTLCGPDSVLGAAAPGEVGVEFLADGSFHLLIRQPDGSVAVGSGPGSVGTWTNVGMVMSGTVQLDLAIDGGAIRSVDPLFFADPSAVAFQTGGEGRARYVRGAPAATAPPTIPSTGTDSLGRTLVTAWVLLAGGVIVLAATRRRAR